MPVVTSSNPPVILDGHHRVAASALLGIKRIPVWSIDIGDDHIYHDRENMATVDHNSLVEEEEELTSVRCYARADNSRILIRDVAKSARSGVIGFGIKGTRHVAVIHSEGNYIEVKLEKLSPRIAWGVWVSSGTRNSTEVMVPFN